MTTFTRTWNASYEQSPEDDDDALEGALRIREVREDVRERLEVDHSWAGDAHDGKHKQVSFIAQGSDPTLDADNFALYCKSVGGKTNLFFKDEDGTVIQMTGGGVIKGLPPGAIVAFAGAIATGFLECTGQAVSRSTYADLFTAIGTTYGAGDGSTTFNVPDCTGRTIFGKESVATRLTNAVSGVDGATLGETGGDQLSQQHTHTASSSSDGAHTHTITYYTDLGGGGGAGRIDGLTTPAGTQTSSSSGAHTHTITVNDFGTGASQNIPPAIVLRWGIKY